MTIPIERWLLDTNIWVFGLRRERSLRDCSVLLNEIGSFTVVIPLQVLKELSLNLNEDEIKDFYRLVNQYPEGAELSWQSAPIDRVKFYEERGCRKGTPQLLLMPKHLQWISSLPRIASFCKRSRVYSLEYLNQPTAIARLSSA